MASGQQKAQKNLEAFEVWKSTQADDDFQQIVFRGQLNRIGVALLIKSFKAIPHHTLLTRYLPKFL